MLWKYHAIFRDRELQSVHFFSAQNKGSKCWAAYGQGYQQSLCKAHGKKEIFLKIFISNHRSYPVKNVSWEFWKPRREVRVTEEGFISWWKRVGEEQALDTGDAQNCRTSTDCSWKLSRDDQTRSSKTTVMAGKPELGQAQKRTDPFTYLLACWPASSDPGQVWVCVHVHCL